MTDTITLTGIVATPPRHLVTGEGLPITSFRLASTQRRFDRSKERWVDGETNWFTITTFRQLAINVSASIVKGDRIVTTGRLRVRDWESGDRAGTTVELDADALGHDLSWGTTAFTRTIATAVAEAAEAGWPRTTDTAADSTAPGSDQAEPAVGTEAAGGESDGSAAEGSAPDGSEAADATAAVPVPRSDSPASDSALPRSRVSDPAAAASVAEEELSVPF
jgi:single-strand DNA-binding protein